MCERFGNLAEGKRALEHKLVHTNPLCPDELDHRLRAAGIRKPEVQKALSAVASKAGTQGGAVSLDAAINTMRATRRSGSKLAGQGYVARSTVKHETTPLWDQLRAVQKDLRRRYDDEDQAEVRGSIPDSLPQTPPNYTDKRRFTASVDGAVRLAETSRSKFVLHCAKRQVIGLEERWATNQSPSPAWSPRPPGLPLAPAARSPPPMAARSPPCESRGSSGPTRKPGFSCGRSSSEPSLNLGSLPDVTPPSLAQKRLMCSQRHSVTKCTH